MRSEVRELREAALGGLAADAGIDLVAAAGLPASAIPLLAGLRKRLMLPLLWVGGAPEAEGPMREIACLAFGARARSAVAAFRRDHGSLDVRCTILGPRVPDARLAEALSVEALERSFLDAWTTAGGSPFDVAPQAPPGLRPRTGVVPTPKGSSGLQPGIGVVPTPEGPAGGASARVVVHHGLRDATTLETTLALIEAAHAHVWVVNGFPLLLEIQHALLRAIARGVTVRAIVGRTTPTHEETPFRGPFSTARRVASELVDSRLDALVAAGAEVYRLAVSERPGWATGLGTVHSHVHAKVVSVDGRVCSVGSANLDVTAAYWEDELLLVVEDGTVAGALEARLEEIASGSERIGPEDPKWRETARRRAWMLRWPGMLSV